MKAETTLKKHLSFVAMGTAMLLLAPLIAMQFTSDVVWTLSDFIFAGGLLFGTGATFTVVLHKMKNNFYRIGAGIALVSTLLLVWVNGAVGIVGHEGEPINLLYYIIPAVGLIGAFLSRFKLPGLYYTLCIMAVIPMVIAIIALLGYMQEPPQNSATQILGINMFFTVLFSLSAISFRNAVRDQNENELASD